MSILILKPGLIKLKIQHPHQWNILDLFILVCFSLKYPKYKRWELYLTLICWIYTWFYEIPHTIHVLNVYKCWNLETLTKFANLKSPTSSQIYARRLMCVKKKRSYAGKACLDAGMLVSMDQHMTCIETSTHQHMLFFFFFTGKAKRKSKSNKDAACNQSNFII